MMIHVGGPLAQHPKRVMAFNSIKAVSQQTTSLASDPPKRPFKTNNEGRIAILLCASWISARLF